MMDGECECECDVELGHGRSKGEAGNRAAMLHVIAEVRQ